MKNRLIKSVMCLLILAASARAQPVFHSETGKRIALTFDACMTQGMAKKLQKEQGDALFNPEIIDFLHSEKIRATIFITGIWAEQYPEKVKWMASDPLFEIGNHSYSHRSFTEDCFSLPVIPEKEKASDIQKTQDILFHLTGRKPKLFRFPGGCYGTADQALVKSLGLRSVGWNFASGDAFNSDTRAIVENVLLKAKPGAIVVFHLSGGRQAPKTAEVIRAVVPELRKRGFAFVTVSEL